MSDDASPARRARTATRALLALAAIALVGAVAVGWTTSGLVERGVAARAAASIRAAGLDWLRAEADGAALTLRGAPPDAAAAEAARALAATGFDRFATVRDALDPVPAAAAAQPALLPPAALDVMVGADSASFAGRLPDLASRARVAEALARATGAAPRDLCEVGASADASWRAIERAALDAVALLAHGRVTATASGVEVVGSPRDAAARARLAALATRADPPLRLDLVGEAPTAGAEPPTDTLRDAPPDVVAAPAPVVAARGAAWLRAQLAPDLVTLTGAAPDEATRAAVLSYARSAFGAARLHDGLALAEGPAPEGWRAAAFAAVDALAALETGVALVAEGRIDVSGATPDPLAVRRAADALAAHRAAAQERGAAAQERGAVAQESAAGSPESLWRAASRVTVDLPARAAATKLSPARCAAEMTDLAAARPILFEPGEARIVAESALVIDALAGVARRCAGAIVVEGHTDAQGSEGYNQRLSQSRAEAVREALVARGAPPEALGALGYGEARPIADNESESGRALNRRIAFAARDPAPGNPAAAETDPAPPETAAP